MLVLNHAWPNPVEQIPDVSPDFDPPRSIAAALPINHVHYLLDPPSTFTVSTSFQLKRFLLIGHTGLKRD